ncbi:3-hydroxyacyl-CoA dehydrogenase NAD-binding domain-containing protein [Pusillimonas minor]|uniref:L-gulonate 3-dehydrogenase n=1 Tax=Pusillimonas minor TaxID=2697024 RepID=A0A842HLT2_9BURK|nr:3-hydroxyacyl-CoA dehydrogenase NAD-binding domain-containing protein [Pusillimonas minor]MBC2769247.1 3-hydroxyacyl-CoA dehydrogenase [Pusillimonas minor]
MALNNTTAQTNPPAIVAIGAGRMGRGIAVAYAIRGQSVVIVDFKPRSAEQFQALQNDIDQELNTTLQQLADLGMFSADQVAQHRARISVVSLDQAAQALAGAHIIYEGVPETLDAKRDALGRICQAAPADAIIASTTSTMLASDLAAMVTHPERFMNAHWLNPAYIIPLVEISAHNGPVTAPGTETGAAAGTNPTTATGNAAATNRSTATPNPAATSPEALAALKSSLKAIGKVPVQCGCTPGFIVPRLQTLIMNEAARMVEEGVATAEEIDLATRYGLGFRFASIGVLEFIDYGGNDILYHASRYLADNLDPTRYTAPDIVQRYMHEGKIGLRSASGFLSYEGVDLNAYRRDVLARTLGMLRHFGLDQSIPSTTVKETGNEN